MRRLCKKRIYLKFNVRNERTKNPRIAKYCAIINNENVKKYHELLYTFTLDCKVITHVLPNKDKIACQYSDKQKEQKRRNKCSCIPHD